MTNSTNNLTQKGLSAAKYTVFFRIIAQGLGLVATVCLVRLLSEHDYGIYNLLYSLIALMGMLFSFGIANTLQRYMPEYYSRGEYTIAHRLYKTAAIIRLMSNVAVLGGVLLFWDNLAPLLKLTEYKTYFILFCLIILLHLQRGILETCLSSYFLQKYSQGIAVFFITIKGIGYITALLLSWDIWLILIIDLIAYSLTFILLEIVYHKKIPKQGGEILSFSQEERKRLTRYAFFYNFNDAGIGLLNTNFDNFIIVMFLDPIAVGAYAFSHRISKMAEQILPINYLLQVIRPLFFSSKRMIRVGDINQNYQLLLKSIYIFQIPLFCFFLLYSQECIIILFGGKFVDYHMLLVSVSLFSLLNAFQVPVGLVAQLKERSDIILYSKFFAVYNLIADVILIHFFGLWGAVLATGSATFGKNLFIWYFVRAEANLIGMQLFWVKTVGYWTIISSFGFFFNSLVLNHLISLIFGGGWLALAFLLQFRFLHLKEQEYDFLYNLGLENNKIALFLKWSGLAQPSKT